MKQTAMILAFLVTLLTGVAAANAIDTAGALAVVCKNTDGSYKSVEMLDLFEGRTNYGLNVITHGPDVDSNILAVQNKLKTIFSDVGLKQLPSEYVEKAQSSLQFYPDDSESATVASVMALPQNCGLKQVSSYQEDTGLLVHAKYWNAMDGVNKAALIVHEAVYMHESERGDKTPERTRKLVAYLFSDYKFESLKSNVPVDANTCRAYDKYDDSKVAFEFYKFTDNENPLMETLQFTKFRNRYPYSTTRITTPKWSWPKEDGDLFLIVDSSIELFDEIVLRREWSETGALIGYYFDEINGDYQIKCAQSTEAELALLKLALITNFEPVAVGGSRSLTYEIENIGKGQALAMSGSGLAAPFSFAGGKFPGIGGTCSVTLAPKSKCTVVVQYSPKSAGVANDGLEITYNDGTGTQLISTDVTGTAVSPALLTITGGPVANYGSLPVGAFSSKTFTVTNTGGISATGVSFAITGAFGFVGGGSPGNGGTCGSTISAAGSCTIVVQYAPTTISVSDKGVITVSYSSGASTSSINRDLVGASVAPGKLTLTDADPYDFGLMATGSVATRTFIVKNVGGYQVSSISGNGLSAPFSFAGNYFPGKGGNCYSYLSPGATCTIVVSFAPVASGSYSDSVELPYNDGARPQIAARTLQGTGASPALLTISNGPTYNYGFVYPGSTAKHTFTVVNSGSVTATSITASGLKAPFSFSGGSYPGALGTCGKTLAAGASCTLTIDFSPEDTGSAGGVVTLSYDTGVSGASTSRALTGVAGQPAELVLTTGTIYNFGSTVVGSEKTLELTIVNTGASAATQLQAANGFQAPYSFKGGAFPGQGGTCGSALEVSEACTVVIAFVPSQPGVHSETLAISYNDGNTKQIVVQYFEGTGITTRSWEPWNFFAYN